MFRQFFLGQFLLIVFSCKTSFHINDKSTNVDTTLQILTHGLPDREQQRAMNSVAKKYGFRYYGVAGCIVSEHLLDSVNKENERVYKILEQRFGKDWLLTFATEVDTMERLQAQVEELVKKENYIVDKENELEKDGNGLYYLIDPTDKQNVFAVKAYGWGQWNGETELIVYYKLTVNLTMEKVIKNSNMVEPLYNRN